MTWHRLIIVRKLIADILIDAPWRCLMFGLSVTSYPMTIRIDILCVSLMVGWYPNYRADQREAK